MEHTKLPEVNPFDWANVLANVKKMKVLLSSCTVGHEQIVPTWQSVFMFIKIINATERSTKRNACLFNRLIVYSGWLCDLSVHVVAASWTMYKGQEYNHWWQWQVQIHCEQDSDCWCTYGWSIRAFVEQITRVVMWLTDVERKLKVLIPWRQNEKDKYWGQAKERVAVVRARKKKKRQGFVRHLWTEDYG